MVAFLTESWDALHPNRAAIPPPDVRRFTLAAPIEWYRLRGAAQECSRAKTGIGRGTKMFRYLKNVRISLDVPAPAAVVGVLLVAALTKGGHPGWGVGGVLALYVLCALYVAIRNSTRRADIRRQALGARTL